MRDEIETILDVNLDAATTYAINKSTLRDSDQCKREHEKLIEACQSLQQSLPDDIGERREAAAEFIANEQTDKNPASPFTKESLLKAEEPGILELYYTQLNQPMLELNPVIFDAWVRLAGYTGKLDNESEYYPPEPDYPSQWLEHMSDESAEWLFAHLRAYGFHYVDRGNGKDGAPRELVENGFVATNIVDKSDDPGDFKVQDCPLKAAFLTGGLELPKFINEEAL